jgi:ferredoxin
VYDYYEFHATIEPAYLLFQTNEVMPNRLDKNTSNVAGPYYVDGSCVDCDMCREIAPDVFRRDEGGMSYVFHQPAADAEKLFAEEARTSCPTESIGNDGTET